MSDIMNILPYSADLSKPLDKTDLHTLFVMGDNQAHRFELEILSGSKAVDLTGATVTGYFTNFKEDTTVTVPGKVEGGKAVVVLSKPCYTLHGQFVLAIQVKSGEVEDTVFLGEGFMRRTKGETIIYDDYIVYDVNTLLAQISAMKTATENANKAAADANAAAEHAPYVDEATGFWMYWDVGEVKYVSTGTPATGPQGIPGNTPYIGSNGNWWIGQTDTGVKAQGPAGQNGTGSGTVTGVKIGDASYAPDASGMVDMSGMTAPNATQLNGKDAKYYIQPIELLDNPEFAIAQAGYGGYHGNTMYAADRWFVEHGESAITVERSNGVTTISTSASGLAMVSQKLSDGAMLRMPNGTPVTLAVCGKDGDIKTTTFIYEEPAVVGKVFDSTVIAAGMQVNLFQDLSNERPSVRIYTDEITTVAFKWIRLIPGTYTAENLPPYVPKGYAVELAECQRYAVKINRMIAAGVCTLNGTAVLFIPLPAQMRGGLTVSDIGTLWSYGSAGANHLLEFAYPMRGNTGVELHFTTDTTANEAIIVPDLTCFISSEM